MVRAHRRALNVIQWLTSKGQITLPAEIRKEMGLKGGDRLQFNKNPETGTYEMTRKTGSIMDLKGIVKYDGPPVSIEQMNQAIARFHADDDERIKREYRDYLESERRSGLASIRTCCCGLS